MLLVSTEMSIIEFTEMQLQGSWFYGPRLSPSGEPEIHCIKFTAEINIFNHSLTDCAFNQLLFRDIPICYIHFTH